MPKVMAIITEWVPRTTYQASKSCQPRFVLFRSFHLNVHQTAINDGSDAAHSWSRIDPFLENTTLIKRDRPLNNPDNRRGNTKASANGDGSLESKPDALLEFSIEYKLTHFLGDLTKIRDNTFKKTTIRHAFEKSSMWPMDLDRFVKQPKTFSLQDVNTPMAAEEPNDTTRMDLEVERELSIGGTSRESVDLNMDLVPIPMPGRRKPRNGPITDWADEGEQQASDNQANKDFRVAHQRSRKHEQNDTKAAARKELAKEFPKKRPAEKSLRPKTAAKRPSLNTFSFEVDSHIYRPLDVVPRHTRSSCRNALCRSSRDKREGGQGPQIKG
ncbi:hypothetical protein MMC07_003993 [Pseudocyphellaria aurata]|nr:hypothetical protein [Pseudocyphellaria aurata]